MANSSTLPLNADTLLRERRLRATPARVATLEVLLSAGRALTHQEVDEVLAGQGESLDRVTLYRTLDFLVAEDLAHRLAGEDRTWRFSAQPLVSGHAHPHFRCDRCGDTRCLGGMNPAMVVGLPEGYVFHGADITIRGLCPGCTATA